MIQGHGGNVDAMAQQLGCPPEQIVDMSSNINPLGMPPGLMPHLQNHLHRIGVLPEADGNRAVHHLSALLDVDPGRILAGNGTTQFIYTACVALNSKKVLIVGPTYADYADACRIHGIEPRYFLADAKHRFAIDLNALSQAIPGCDTVFICNPNNPTGHLIPHVQLLELGQVHAGVRFIIDESYLPFSTAGPPHHNGMDALDNVSFLWSLSKIFGVPGLRAGFLIAHPATASRFSRYMQPWSLNSLAQAALDYLGEHPEAAHAFIQKSRTYLESEKERLCEGITARTPLNCFPSRASYVLMETPEGLTAEKICGWMAQKRILIRNCSNFHGLSGQFIRVSLKDRHTNQMALQCLVEFFSGHPL